MARRAPVVALTLAIVCALSQRSLAQAVSPGIAGNIHYYSNDAAVPNVIVQLNSDAGLSSADTNADGAYVLAAPGQGGYRVEPIKTGGRNGAVSALDAAWVLQAVVGLRQPSANQRLACDVTGDGTISALDAARILQFVAGLSSTFPAAQSCGSDWIFVPAAATAQGEQLVQPQMAPVCSPGAISFDGLETPANAQDFVAIVLGDCTGNWQPSLPSATATPTDSAPPTPTSTDPPLPPTATPASTATASQAATATASRTATATTTSSATATLAPSTTPSVTATPTRTGTATRTTAPTASATSTRTPSSTAPPTGTDTATASATSTKTSTSTRTPFPTATATGTITQTPSVTLTPSMTATRTPFPSSTPTRTFPSTPTSTNTSTVTVTYTGTSTRTGTRTATPTVTATASPTPTATCADGLAWNVSSPLLISSQSGGDLWLAKTVPTDFGWGIFWLRDDPGASQVARLYYAHVDFSGQITAGPLTVIDVPKIAFRGHYYFAAWNQDHYGLTISNQATLYYYSLSLDGVISGQKVVPVPLFLSPIYDQESDGDLDAFPGGFLGVIEAACDDHSCSYAYKLDVNGNSTTSPINLVDFDFTHQFYPRAAFDGAGFALLSVKDIDITNGGVTSKYLSSNNALSANAKVVPAKQYLWDEFPDIAFNGDHFAALWTENSARSDSAPWQIHFASFRRTKSASTRIADRVLDVVAQKTNQRWTTQVHAIGGAWVAQYASRAADGSIVAVYELLGDDAQTVDAVQPFALTADALGSSPHYVAGHVGELGIARGANLSQGSEVTFQTLPPPACAP